MKGRNEVNVERLIERMKGIFEKGEDDSTENTTNIKLRFPETL
jgi:hypothetical protein